jgi:WhiB family transcriptional regulator, redox-sensing transcriptional regulator
MEESVPVLSMGSFAAHGSQYSGVRKSGLKGWGMFNAWEEQAACQNTSLELWFGEERPFGVRKAYRTKQQTEKAKAICARCPVLDDCRRWAMESGIPYGIVGAMTEVERQQLIRQGEAAWPKFWKQQDRASGRSNHQTRKTHCPQGHEYNEENTHLYQGRRYCIPCMRRRHIEYRQRKKEELGHWPWEQQQRPTVERTCVVCGEMFHIRKANQLCCSPSCSAKWKWMSREQRQLRQNGQLTG